MTSTEEKPTLLQFETLSSCMVCGPTNLGMTWFVKRMLENARLMFKEPPTFVLYWYRSVWQLMFDDMQQNVKSICFHEGLPIKVELLDIHRDNGHFICDLDDLMSESANSVEVERFVCIGSRHLNMTIICLFQNKIQKGKVMRTLSLNTHYCVLYKNRRDQEQIQRFGRQAFLQQSKYFLDAYLKAASTPYGYLLVDLNPHSCKLYSFGTRFFPGEDIIVYRPSNEETDLGKCIIFVFFIFL